MGVKMRKKTFVLIIFFITIFILNLYSAEKFIKIPLRIISKDNSGLHLQKNDFTLKINNKTITKFDFSERQRDMLNQGLPLKYYILDFNLLDYYDEIGKGIDYFIDNILKNEPVIITTRNKIYKFYNYNSKQYLKDSIKKLVKQDTINFKAETKSYYKKFKEILTKFIGKTAGGSGVDKDSCKNFINDYLREWKLYKSRYVYPDLRKYQMVSNMLSKKDGDKYIISFQHREIIPFYDDVQKAISAMSNFVSSAAGSDIQGWVTMISGGINDINQSLLLSKDFPSQILTNIFLSNNIQFNIILLNNKMNIKEGEGYNSVSPDMEKVFRDISLNSGGLPVTTDNIKDAIGNMVKHKDLFYCLKVPSKAQDMKIKIIPKNKKLKLSYVNNYSKNFIKTFFKIEKRKVSIYNVNVINKRISFSIKHFIMKNVKGVNKGVLKVNIFVVNDNGDTVYKTGNILNSVKKSVNIKLPPVRFSGNYNTIITVEDILGESSRIFQQKFKF